MKEEWNLKDPKGNLIDNVKSLAKHCEKPLFFAAWWVLENRNTINFPESLLDDAYTTLCDSSKV